MALHPNEHNLCVHGALSTSSAQRTGLENLFVQESLGREPIESDDFVDSRSNLSIWICLLALMEEKGSETNFCGSILISDTFLYMKIEIFGEGFN